MADFVAVIRRAVDGLSDNSPEMRAKVYDKARSAVVRQLENMKPRPPEVMFKRQLDKLDDAIRQVEEQHSGPPASEPEAAPVAEPIVAESVVEESPEPGHAEAAPAAAPPAEAMVEPAPVEPARHEPTHQEPVHAEPVHAAQVQAEPEQQPHDEPAPLVAEAGRYDEPAYQQPAYQESVYEEPVAADEQAPQDESIQAHEQRHDTFSAATHDEPAEQVPAAEIHHEAVPAQAEDHVEEHEDPVLAHAEPHPEAARGHVGNRVMEQPFMEADAGDPAAQHDDRSHAADSHEEPAYREPQYQERQYQEPVQEQTWHSQVPHEEQPARQAERAEAAMPDWGVDIDREPDAASAPETDRAEPAVQMPRAALNETDVATGFNEFLKQEFATPAVPPPPGRKSQDGDFSWDAPFDDLPDLPKPVAFEQALEARQREIGAIPDRQDAGHQKNARAELEDLIGYDGGLEEGGNRNGDGEKLPPEVTRAMSKLEGKSFRVHKKKKKYRFSPLPIALGVVGALFVAGAAYGLYHYRDDVEKLVASYMPSSEADSPSDASTVAPAEEQSAVDTPRSVEDKAAEADTAPAETAAEPTEVASLDPNLGPTKFTQRLLADGTETETDAAKIPVDQTLKEGKTIAGRTNTSDQVASTDATVPATAQEDAAKAENPALAVTQKMFLYEERLGGSPVAVPGTVTWTAKPDTTNTSGKAQQMIEASLDVPDRKIKALISFKRNSDASLPASHIIEVVFDLPADFSEGNVESVQRIAFKQTEQDRGNSLIAVPAKITDDFHMIALNDDAEARKVNTELMKTRSWIDIPITYRNNRRALITLEKGATGTDAFDKVMAQWAALGPIATNN